MLKSKIVLPAILVFLIISCHQNTHDALSDQLSSLTTSVFDYNRYEESIIGLEEIVEKDPEFYFGLTSAEEMLVKCYEATNDFDKLDSIYSLAQDKYNENLKHNVFKHDVGLSIFEVISARVFLKTMQFDLFDKYDNLYLNAIDFDAFSEESVELAALYHTFIIEHYVNQLVMNCLMINYSYISQEAFDSNIRELQSMIIKELTRFNNDEAIYTLADIINFQTADGQYYCDILFEEENLKDFLIFCRINEVLSDEGINELNNRVYREDKEIILGKIQDLYKSLTIH